MSRFGVGGQNIDPLAYQDSRLSTVPVVQAPRRPTTSDKKFPIWCEWRVNKDAVAPTNEGEFWKLIKYESNGDATWVMMDTGAGTPGIDDLRDQVNAQVGPSLSGFIDIDGNVVANAANPSGIPLETVADAAGDTLDIQIQVAADITGAPGDKNDAGLCSFDDTAFVVDTDGYVTLIGGGSGPAFVSLDVDFNTAPGTDPVLADGSGQISVLGNIVANATNLNSPVATHSRAANALTVEVQLGTAVTPTPADAFDAGLFCANTNQFTVDATSGMLSLKGGTTNPPVTSFTLDDTNAATADGTGDIDITGAIVANATNAKPLFSARNPASDDIDLQLQVSQEITGAPADSNDAGISSFDDTAFVVDANGYVTLVGGGTGPAFVSLDVDANTGPGTDPVIADGSGQIAVAGAAVANHAVPVETHSRAANTMNVEVQVSAAVTGAPGDTNDAGISSFDDTAFSVDADGYVTFIGGQSGVGGLNQLSLVDDFLYRYGSHTTGTSSVWGKLGWVTSFNNSSMSSTETTAAHPGVMKLTASGTQSIYLGGMFIGGGAIQMTWIIKLESVSSARTRIGFLGTTGTVQDNGIFFKWEKGVNSDNWQVISANGGTTTIGNTSVAGAADWVKLQINVNAGGTSVEFLIDEVEPTGSPITTNLPTAIIQPRIYSNKSLFIDYFQLEQTLSVSR